MRVTPAGEQPALGLAPAHTVEVGRGEGGEGGDLLIKVTLP